MGASASVSEYLGPVRRLGKGLAALAAATQLHVRRSVRKTAIRITRTNGRTTHAEVRKSKRLAGLNLARGPRGGELGRHTSTGVVCVCLCGN